MVEKKAIERQVEAEVALGEALETQGVTPMQFMKQWKLTHHQFNVLAHSIYGVNDEEPDFSPMLRALLFAIQQAQRAA